MKLVISKKKVILVLISALFVTGLIVGLVFAYRSDLTTKEDGAVVANGRECAEIGRSILSKGGSAVDAAIATLFCEGVTCPQSMGIGGGFLATIYIREKRKVETLVAREAAPKKATKEMFKDVDDITGGIAVGVPGEVRGYWAMHKKHGILPWASLIEPTIELCKNGHYVSPYLARSLKRYESIIRNETLNFADVFINKKTGEVWNKGDYMKQPDLAKTLEIIARDGENAIYNGVLTKTLVDDIQRLGGIIIEDDFKDYKIRWNDPVEGHVDDKHTLYSVPLPGSGIVLTFILNLLYDLRTNNKPLLYHRIVESFKHAYGQRTQLGDVKFAPEIEDVVKSLANKEFIEGIRRKIFDDRTSTDYAYYGANFSNFEDHGTANMAVLASNGDAVVVTSTVNTIFGAKFRSKTGIILNDEMDDFSTPNKTNGFGIPPSPANFIVPEKMPMSSMCPSIIVDEKGDVRLLIGAAGGSKITTSVALSIIRYIMFNEPLNDAIQSNRLHHQLAPMEVQYEDGFDKEIIEFLSNTIKHKVNKLEKTSGFAAVTAIGNIGELTAIYDYRRNGSASVF